MNIHQPKSDLPKDCIVLTISIEMTLLNSEKYIYLLKLF